MLLAAIPAKERQLLLRTAAGDEVVLPSRTGTRLGWWGNARAVTRCAVPINTLPAAECSTGRQSQS